MRFSKHVFLLVLLLTLSGVASAQFANFITSKGDKLMDGDREFRFISVNIPNLHYVEDYLPFRGTNPWRFPDEFEIRDALTSVQQMGGKVVRIYVFSVRKANDTATVYYVDGPGKFNEEAFKTFDKVLQIANEVGIRLIIPFVDNWVWWGGPREYEAFRGKSKGAFWTDREVIDDFKKTVEFIINRTNTVTGIPYKDDKAVLAWETGNELEPPFAWTQEIAAYVKSLDRNHLLLEGTHVKTLSTEALEDPNLDILSTHHYGDPKVSLGFIVKNREFSKGKKPYLIGEYGIIPTEDIRTLTDTIINQGLSGGMLWALRYRCREGGFYHHYEYNDFESYRWPGFNTGYFYDEKVVLELLREKAFQIDGSAVERLPAPKAPVMLPITDVAAISWQGSTGAQSYVLERRSERDSLWTVLNPRVDESRYQYRPLASDETAVPGMAYFYRVKAKNETGESPYSSAAGPVQCTASVLVDEMEDFSKIFQKDGELGIVTTESLRQAKEDRSRLAGKSGSYIVYKLPTDAVSVLVDFFAVKSGKRVKVYIGGTLDEMKEAAVQEEVFSFGRNEYGFFDAISLRAGSLPDNMRFVKVELEQGTQVSRIEIRRK